MNDMNGVFDEEYAYIKRLYAERQEKRISVILCELVA